MLQSPAYFLQLMWFKMLSPLAMTVRNPVSRFARKLAEYFPNSLVHRTWKKINWYRSNMTSRSGAIGHVSIEEVVARDCCLCQGWFFHPKKTVEQLSVLGANEKYPIDVYGLHHRFAGQELQFFPKAYHSRLIGMLPRSLVPKASKAITMEVEYSSGEREFVSFKIAPQSRAFLGVPLENS